MKKEKLYIIYGGTKYEAVEATCENCGKKYLAGKRWLARAKHHYCCNACAGAGKAKFAKKDRADTWAAEQHKCEHCGKIMAEKFGSGRFCSRACANSHKHSDKTKQKIARSLIDHQSASTAGSMSTKAKAIERYSKSPKYCLVCGKELSYEQRHLSTCSNECYHKLLTQRALERHFGGLTIGCGKKSKNGYYNGIRCDSTYELIYLVYCLENNINIKRNNKYFLYTNIEGKIKKYYPDFYLPDTKTYIELKGYKDENVDIKLAAVKASGANIEILYKADLKNKLDFINKKLTKNYNIEYADIAELYDMPE